MSDWVESAEEDGQLAWHRGGVPWHEAPLPARMHVCRPQSRVYASDGPVDRCSCGAVRFGRGPWEDRNIRRGRWMDSVGTHPPNE